MTKEDDDTRPIRPTRPSVVLDAAQLLAEDVRQRLVDLGVAYVVEMPAPVVTAIAFHLRSAIRREVQAYDGALEAQRKRIAELDREVIRLRSLLR